MKKCKRSEEKLATLVGELYTRGYNRSLIGSIIGKYDDCVRRLLDASIGASWKTNNPNEFKPFSMDILVKKTAQALTEVELVKSHTVAIKFNKADFEKKKQLAISKLKSGKSL